MRQPSRHPRILHILNTADRRGTGIAKIVRTIATLLADRFDFSVWFVYEDGPLVEFFREAGVDARTLAVMPGFTNPAGPLRLWLASHRHQFDLVHHHAADTKIRWLVRAAMGAPVLLHLHARAVETSAPAPMKMSTRFANRVIAASAAVAQFTSGNSEVVYYGIEPGSPSINPDGTVVLGTASRLIALKGVDRLLRALAIARRSNPNLLLEIAGDGPEAKSLRQLSDSLGLTDAVKFLGWEDDVRLAMRRWSIYVQPSLEEGLGISIVEAMTEALPVLATRVGGIPEAVADGETGCLVPPGDEAALAARILELAGDPDRRRRMGERAAAAARERFSVGRFSGRIAQIYDEMLTGARRPTTS